MLISFVMKQKCCYENEENISRTVLEIKTSYCEPGNFSDIYSNGKNEWRTFFLVSNWNEIKSQTLGFINFTSVKVTYNKVMLKAHDTKLCL